MYNLTNATSNDVMIGIDVSTIKRIINQTNKNISYLNSIAERYDIPDIISYKIVSTETVKEKKSVSRVISNRKNKTLKKTLVEAQKSSVLNQKKQMKILDKAIENKSPVKYMKANVIANKSVAIKFGIKKSISKSNMTEEMLKFRDIILEKITALMIAKDMGVIDHVSKIVYNSIERV